MIYENPTFSKESLKGAASHIGFAAYTLIYDGNDEGGSTEIQIKAGKELWQAEWIIATVIDHIFDYYPVSYFMNEDSREQYPEFLEWFIKNPEIGVENAIKYVENNFAVLETVTRDEYNQHRIPNRKLEKEEHVKKVLLEIQNNLDEIVCLLLDPKKITDAERPTPEEISMLINTIESIQDQYSRMADERGDKDFTQHIQILNMYKLPLLKAWEVYHYGSYSDFWEEGESMFEYIMFDTRAKEMVQELANSLKKQSPFALIERNSAITNGLIKVYEHLLKHHLGQQNTQL